MQQWWNTSTQLQPSIITKQKHKLSQVKLLLRLKPSQHHRKQKKSSCCSSRIWQKWCVTAPTRRSTLHKSWIIGQLAHSCILQRGGGGVVLCFLTLGGRTPQWWIVLRGQTESRWIKKTHWDSWKHSDGHSPWWWLSELGIIWVTGSGVTDETLKRSLGLINRSVRVLQDTCLFSLFDLIDALAPGALHRGSVGHLPINLHCRWWEDGHCELGQSQKPSRGRHGQITEHVLYVPLPEVEPCWC